MPSVALCFSVTPSTDFACVPESTEGIPQGSILVTIFPACTAINHAVAGAVTVEASELLMYGPTLLISSYKQEKSQHHTCLLCFVYTFVNFELKSVEHHFL